MKLNNFQIKEIPINIYDILNFKQNLLNETSDKWLIYNYRQKNFQVHSNTETIPIFWLPNTWNPNYYLQNETIIYRCKEFVKYIPFIENLYNNHLKEIYPNCTIIKAMIANLKPHSIIYPHYDTAPCLQVAHRCHLVIKTNPNVYFYIDDTKFILKEDHMYEINNLRLHSVLNNSDENRYHLIIDLLDNNYFKNNIIYVDIDSSQQSIIV